MAPSHSLAKLGSPLEDRGDEPAIHQHVSSPFFQKFGIAVQDSAEETTLVRPHHSNLKAADLYGPSPSSLFYDKCLSSDVCPPTKLGSLLGNRGDDCSNGFQVWFFIIDFSCTVFVVFLCWTSCWSILQFQFRSLCVIWKGTAHTKQVQIEIRRRSEKK